MGRQPEQSDFERRTAWVEEHDRARDEAAEKVRMEHREWAQAELDRAFNLQVEILNELRRIKVMLRDAKET